MVRQILNEVEREEQVKRAEFNIRQAGNIGALILYP
jgi:hypothetical protein